MDSEEEKTVKGKKAKAQKEESEEDEEKTKKKKSKSALPEEQKFSGSLIPTLSGALKSKPDQNSALDLIENSRILTHEIKRSFSEMDHEHLLATATKSQVVYVQKEKTEIDFKDTKGIRDYMKKKGRHYTEVYSLDFLAQGGESYVLRADLKQPLEVVVKTVLPGNVSQETLTSILSESHLVNLLTNKDHVVEIREEIVEVDENKKVLNYLVVVEQAIQDLNQILSIWGSYEKSHLNLEFFSPSKLFYFLFKCAQAIAYLHSAHLYYGDLKEANLLIFRDYSVKLGDFGVSLKLEAEEDPDEQKYELKGATSGYTKESLYKGLLEGSGELLSHNQLFENDYECLRRTWKKVKERCEHLLSEQKEDRDYVFAQERQLGEYFLRFFGELEGLHPEKNPLNGLILKYSALVSKDTHFLLNFCSELSTDSKFLALPNILSLWQHSFIPLTLSDYFSQLELFQFPFLCPEQTSKERLQWTEEQLIGKVQEYVEREVEDLAELRKVVGEMVKWKGYLVDGVYNEVYRKTFGKYFEVEMKGEKKNLMKLITEDKETLKAYIQSLNLCSTDKAASIKQVDLAKLTDPTISLLAEFLQFYAHTTNSSDPVDSLVPLFLSKLAFLSSKELILEQFLLFSTDPTLLKYWTVLHDLNTAQQLSYLKRDLDCIDYFECSCYFNKNYYSFNNVGKLMQELNAVDRKHEQQEREEAYNKLAALFDLPSKENFYHKAFHSPPIQAYFTSIQTRLLSDPKILQKNLLFARNIMRQAFGELGNQMSSNAYFLYRTTKEVGADEEGWEKTLTLLRKACTYSNRKQRLEFCVDWLKELRDRGEEKEMHEVFEKSREINELFYFIILEQFMGQPLAVETKKSCTQLLLSSSVQQLFLSIATTSPDFLHMLTKFLGFDPQFCVLEPHFILKKFMLKDGLPRICEEAKKGKKDSQGFDFFRNQVKYEMDKSKKQKVTIFQSNSTLTVEMSNFAIKGNVSLQFDNHYFSNEVYSGSLERLHYKARDFQAEGRFNPKEQKYYLTSKEKHAVFQSFVGVVNGFGVQINQNIKQFCQGLCENFKMKQGRQQIGWMMELEEVVDWKQSKSGTRMKFCDGSVEIDEFVKGIQSSLTYKWMESGTYQESFRAGNNTETQVYFVNGVLQEEYTTVKDQKSLDQVHGHRVEFFTNGTKKKEENYTMGVKDLNYKLYYDNGQIAMESTLLQQNNKKIHQIITYSREGVVLGLSQKVNNENWNGASFTFNEDRVILNQRVTWGQFNFEERFFYKNGAFEKTNLQLMPILFKNGALQAKTEGNPPTRTYFDLLGNVLGEKKPLNAALPEITYYDSGQVQSTSFKANEKTIFYDNGQLAFSQVKDYPQKGGFDRNGNKIAEDSSFLSLDLDDSGRLVRMRNEKFEKHYNKEGQVVKEHEKQNKSIITLSSSDRKLQAKCFAATKIGSLSSSMGDCSYEFFDDNKKVGSQSHQYFGREGKIILFNKDSGNLLAIEEYSQDYLVSVIYFYPNGKVLREATYKNWALDGVEKTYYPNGAYKESSYKEGVLHGQTCFYNAKGEIDCLIEFEQRKPLGKKINHPAFEPFNLL